MHLADLLATIESEGSRILEFATRDPEAMVPQYPGWTLSDLVSHTASIHARTTLICRQRPLDRISAPRLPNGESPLDWYRTTLAEMITALGEADLSSPAWSFTDDKTLGFWLKRMLIETGIHRWDAQQALEIPDSLVESVARAGLDEFASMWMPRLGKLPTIELRASDLGESWIYGDGSPALAVEDSASRLYLSLMARPGATLPDTWAAAVASLEPPPKR